MSKGISNGESFRVEMTIRNGDFSVVDSKDFSGNDAVPDAIIFLLEKFSPSFSKHVKILKHLM